MTFMWIRSMSATSFAASAAEMSVSWWLWTSMKGYFACAGWCSGTTRVDLGSYSSIDIVCAAAVRTAVPATQRHARQRDQSILGTSGLMRECLLVVRRPRILCRAGQARTGEALPARHVRRHWTTTVPVIIAPCTVQKYGKVPAWLKVWENVIPLPVPESQIPSGVHTVPHVPDVVEWNPETQTHCTVVPTVIVVVAAAALLVGEDHCRRPAPR